MFALSNINLNIIYNEFLPVKQTFSKCKGTYFNMNKKTRVFKYKKINEALSKIKNDFLIWRLSN